MDALLDVLAEFEVDASRASVAELIQERVEWVAQNMRVTPVTAPVFDHSNPTAVTESTD